MGIEDSSGDKPGKIPEIGWMSHIDPAEIARRNLEAIRNRAKEAGKRTPEEFPEERFEAADVIARDIIKRNTDAEPAFTKEVAMQNYAAVQGYSFDDTLQTIEALYEFTWNESRKYLAAIAWRYLDLREENKQMQDPR